MTLDRDQKLAILRRWQDAINRADTLFDPIRRDLGSDPESNLCQSVYGLQEVLTRTTADLLDDGGNWLEWYWLENDLGKKCLDAGKAGNMRSIGNLEGLLEMIELQ